MKISPYKSYIIGGYISKFIGPKHPDFIFKKHPKFGLQENPSIEDYIKEALDGSLNKTKVPIELIEKAWIGNFAGELFSNQGHLGAAVVGSNEKGLLNKPIMRVEAACASGGLALISAVDSVRFGSSDIALAMGVEVQTTVSARQGAEYLARASHFKTQRKIDDFTFPAMFARRIKHMQSERGITPNDLAILSVKAYSNANKNPLAHMRAVKMDMKTAEFASDKNPNFLGNEELKPYLKISDCSQVSDGGAACIIVNENGLKKLGKKSTDSDVIEIAGSALATGNLYKDSDPLKLSTANAAAKQAYSMAKINAKDIQVGEVHDCFTIAELLMYEALGLAESGKGVDLVRNGDTQLTGKIPINTGGGLVGFGHPTGATGIKQVMEVYNQMTGKCGEYQLKKIPNVGVFANMGGDDKTVVVGVLKKT